MSADASGARDSLSSSLLSTRIESRDSEERAAFLEEMEQMVPWRELRSLVEPHYPKAGNGRRLGLSACCAFIFFNSGSTSPTQRWKKHSTTRR